MRAWLVVVLVSACTATPVAREPGPRAVEPRALPPGVVAEQAGQFGVVQVVEQDGWRRLTIDGVVQGGMPVDGQTIEADPLVALAVAAAPGARRALVIGLGTGATARELGRHVPEVLAVERDPVVVDMARAHFGWQGKVEIADGLEVLAREQAPWDLVVIDVFTDGDPPAAFFEARALANMVARRGQRGLVVMRMLGQPGAPFVAAAERGLGKPYFALFGSGVGGEPQNLYLLASGEQAIEVVPPPGLPVRPIRLAHMPLPPPPGTEPVVGYLVRLREDGSLALDAPHAEMGAVRFLLRGDAVKALEGQLPASATFPTQGDIGSDGEVRGTLAPLAGGGGVKRSDVRFSPVLVAVEGRVRFLAAVDPDAVFDGKPLHREHVAPGPIREPRLPYGGVLYELDVSRVIWTYDVAAWTALERQLVPRGKQIVAAISRDDLGAALVAISDLLTAVREATGPAGDQLAAVRQLERLRDGIFEEAGRGVPGTPYGRAVACDRAAQHGPRSWDPAPRVALEVTRALETCALRNYVLATRGKGTPGEAETAAARLSWLYEAADRAKDLAALERRWPDVEPMSEPPAP
jgi:protein-L-isoaspartate O-methyltransferase